MTKRIKGAKRKEKEKKRILDKNEKIIKKQSSFI